MSKFALVCVSWCAALLPAAAQCPQWSDEFYLPGTGGRVFAAVQYDDGSGPALYVAGNFERLGPVMVEHVGRWRGSRWEAVGAGLNGTVQALLPFDDGSGMALFAAGEFTASGSTPMPYIAKWTGASWAPVGVGLDREAYALHAFDDGAGPALFVGGRFLNGGGVGAKRVARWNGAWSAVGANLPDTVLALEHYPVNGVPRLWAGGWFHLSSFDGTSWTLESALDGQIEALEVFDDQGDVRLIAGGNFYALGGFQMRNIGRWNGVSWSSLGIGTDSYVQTLCAVHENGAETLYVGGDFERADGQPAVRVAAFRGNAWSSLPSDFGDEFTAPAENVEVLAPFDLGDGPRLVAGGDMKRADGLAINSLAHFDGTGWSNFEDGGVGLDSQVYTAAVCDAGAGERLFVVGNLSRAGDVLVDGAMQWDGASWSRHGAPFEFRVPIHALSSFDFGAGRQLLVAGAHPSPSSFSSVITWDGQAWAPVGTLWRGSGPGVRDVLALDDGSGVHLYAGGNFADPSGAPFVMRRVARFDGVSWSALPGDPVGDVYDLEAFDFGSGEQLVAAGYFTLPGSSATVSIARFDGALWHALAPAPSGTVFALAVHDDGNGPRLYAAGADGANANVRRWNGAGWDAIGGGVAGSPTLLAMQSYTDGASRVLAVGGWRGFGVALEPVLALWRGGASFEDLQLEGNVVHSLGVLHSAQAPLGALYAVGHFNSIEGLHSRSVAAFFDPCSPFAVSYCTSGTTSSGCAPTMQGLGTPSASAASAFELRVVDVEGAKSGHIFYGASGPASVAWGQSSHVLCVKAPSQRTGTQVTGGHAGACDGRLTLDWNQFVAEHPFALGVPFAPGSTIWAQSYFRDPLGPKTTALSNALQIQLQP